MPVAPQVSDFHRRHPQEWEQIANEFVSTDEERQCLDQVLFGLEHEAGPDRKIGHYVTCLGPFCDQAQLRITQGVRAVVTALAREPDDHDLSVIVRRFI